jgi:pimeloyl-ACP methyl ester carboxylesterase
MKLNFKQIGDVGKPLVILHGLLGTLDNWMTLGKAFANEGFKVYMVDQRNHGKSPHSTDWDYEIMANDLQDFLDQQFIADPIIIGHSMGGKTVMKHAQLYPTAVEKYIVVDISPRHYEPHHQHILAGLRSIDLSALKSRKDADEALEVYVKGFGERQFLLKNLDRTSEGYSWKCNLPVITEKISNVGESQFTEDKIEVPTLFIRGDKSQYIMDDDITLIQRMYTDVQFVTIAEAGHWVHAEQPKEFFQVVKDFA